MGDSFFTCRKIMEMQLTDEDYNVVAMVTRELRGYNVCLETLKLRDALKHILAISRLGNGHIQSEKPWKLVKGSPEEMYTRCFSLIFPLYCIIPPYVGVVDTLFFLHFLCFFSQCPCRFSAEFLRQHCVSVVGATPSLHARDQRRNPKTTECREDII